MANELASVLFDLKFKSHRYFVRDSCVKAYILVKTWAQLWQENLQHQNSSSAEQCSSICCFQPLAVTYLSAPSSFPFLEARTCCEDQHVLHKQHWMYFSYCEPILVQP